MKKLIFTLLLLPLFAFSQGKIVSGVVNDDMGGPLPGATVQVKGSESIGSITDFDGKFIINANVNDVLVITYVGFEKQEFNLTLKKELGIITLRENIDELNELFKDDGLVIIDGDDVHLKKSFVDIMKKDIQDHSFYPLIASQSEKLSENYKAQAYVRECNFFQLEQGSRKRVLNTFAARPGFFGAIKSKSILPSEPGAEPYMKKPEEGFSTHRE